VGARSPAGRAVAPGTTDVVMAQWNLVASSVEPVGVTQVAVWALGDGDDANGVIRVRLVDDANGNGLFDATDPVLGTGTYATDNGSAVFALSPAYTVAAGASRKLLAVSDYAAGITGSWRFGAGLLTTGDLATTGGASGAPVSVMGPPALGAYATVSTPPPQEAKVDPEYSMGGCAAGAGIPGATGAAGLLLPWLALAGALWAARRRSRN